MSAVTRRDGPSPILQVRSETSVLSVELRGRLIINLCVHGAGNVIASFQPRP